MLLSVRGRKKNDTLLFGQIWKRSLAKLNRLWSYSLFQTAVLQNKISEGIPHRRQQKIPRRR